MNFSTDLSVSKSSTHDEYWVWTDSVRGFDKVLKSNEDDQESSGTAITNVSATGFTATNNWFTTGRTYSTFNWEAGTSTVTNNDGSIASQVRAQPSAGFSICTYTGNGTGGASIGHGLNAAVEFLIVKDLSLIHI